MQYWKNADRYERANGITYKEFEIALPNELTRTQNMELVEEFLRQLRKAQQATM